MLSGASVSSVCLYKRNIYPASHSKQGRGYWACNLTSSRCMSVTRPPPLCAPRLCLQHPDAIFLAVLIP